MQQCLLVSFSAMPLIPTTPVASTTHAVIFSSLIAAVFDDVAAPFDTPCVAELDAVLHFDAAAHPANARHGSAEPGALPQLRSLLLLPFPLTRTLFAPDYVQPSSTRATWA
jgi:hypothetical protein